MAVLEIEGDSAAGALALPVEEGQPQLQYLVRGGDEKVALISVRPERSLASLLLVADRWIVLAADGATLAVNHVAVTGFKILDHGDVILVPGCRLRLSQEQVEVLAEGARLLLEHKACRVCQRRFAVGDRVFHCPRCNLALHTSGAEQHDDCWSFNHGKCASSPFCGFYRRAAAAEAAPQATP
jgi:hypothetical protein